MRTILIIVLGLFFAQTIHAQIDSLIIELNNYGHLIIVSPNLVTEKQKSAGLDKGFQDFYTEFKKIDKSQISDKNQIIKYSYKMYEPQYRSISIEEADNGKDLFYFIEGKQKKLPAYKYKLELLVERKVIILLNSLEDLENVSKLSIDSLYLQSLEHLQSQNLSKRISYKVFYSAENNKIDRNSNLVWSGKLNDFLLLNAFAGMSVINSNIAPEWGAVLDFEFRKKGYANLKFGIDYTTMYLSDKDDFFNISSYGFLGLHYYLKYNNNYRYKLSVGYLVNKTGNDFNGKTWNAYWCTNHKDIGFKIGGIYTKNTAGKYVVLPSVGINIGF